MSKFDNGYNYLVHVDGSRMKIQLFSFGCIIKWESLAQKQPEISDRLMSTQVISNWYLRRFYVQSIDPIKKSIFISDKGNLVNNFKNTHHHSCSTNVGEISIWYHY